MPAVVQKERKRIALNNDHLQEDRPETGTAAEGKTDSDAQTAEPSFGECHAHVFMNGTDYRLAVSRNEGHPDIGWIRHVFGEYKKRGITFVREGGDHYGVSLAAKKIAPEFGITYLSPVFGIFREGDYGRVVGNSFRTMSEYTELVRRVKREGGDFIKIMTTGIMDFKTVGGLTGTALPSGEIREMVHIAHEEGFCVMSHTNGAQAVIDAVEAGVDSVEHGNFQNEESLACLAESSAVYVPTVVTVRNLIGDGRFNDAVIRRIWEGIQENLQVGRRLGVRYALGSDAGAYRVLHGQGVEDEFRAFREAFPDDPDLVRDLKAGEQKIRGWISG